MSKMSFTLFNVRFLLHRGFAELVVTAAIGDILYRRFRQTTRTRVTAKTHLSYNCTPSGNTALL